MVSFLAFSFPSFFFSLYFSIFSSVVFCSPFSYVTYTDFLCVTLSYFSASLPPPIFFSFCSLQIIFFSPFSYRLAYFTYIVFISFTLSTFLLLFPSLIFSFHFFPVLFSSLSLTIFKLVSSVSLLPHLLYLK